MATAKKISKVTPAKFGVNGLQGFECLDGRKWWKDLYKGALKTGFPLWPANHSVPSEK